MPLQLLTIPCLSDNFAFLLFNDAREAALIDAPEAAPINAMLESHNLTLTTVLLTHHHWDHVEGLNELNAPENLKVIGAKADAHRLPPLSHPVCEDDCLEVLGAQIKVIDVPGHTVGHIAYYIPSSGHVFTGDSLMAFGCGRLFEGTPGQMYKSLRALATLPDDTLVCSGHEYTQANARFAVAMFPDDADIKARAAETTRLLATKQHTVPSSLALEKRTNPFLRARSEEDFAHLRAAKDTF